MITAVCPGVLGLCNLYFIRNFLSCLKCLNTVVEKSSKYDWQLHWLVSSPDISNVSTPFGLCSFANILWKCSGYSKNWNIICPFFNSCKYCHWSYFVFGVSWTTFFLCCLLKAVEVVVSLSWFTKNGESLGNIADWDILTD